MLALILLAPLLLVLALMLAIKNRGSFLFVQERPGKNQRSFKVYKFKTMADRYDEHGHLLPDKQRLHGMGRFLRSLSLDELPQLINILTGDMSLIGPRPLLFKYIPLYRGDQARRHEVRPGITGWAQVNGRNSISWSEKFAYDVYYVDHLSFWLDLKILWLTVIKVLKREGINQSEERPMQPFDGTN